MHLNSSLIFKLSLFGLVMAFATVYFIPSNVEPFCWLVIFIICAYLIAKKCSSKYFLHGLLVSLVNAVWITTVHILLFNRYIGTHAKEAAMMAKTPMSGSPKLMMLLTGPIVGLLSGLILGFFAFMASKIVKNQSV